MKGSAFMSQNTNLLPLLFTKGLHMNSLFPLQCHCGMIRMDSPPPDFNINLEACTYTVYWFGLCAWYFFIALIYFVIVETSQATQRGIIKYYYNCSTNDSMKDYQRQRRSRTYVLKGISSVTVTARANIKCCILGIYWHFVCFLIKMLSCVSFDRQAWMCCFGAFY